VERTNNRGRVKKTRRNGWEQVEEWKKTRVTQKGEPIKNGRGSRKKSSVYNEKGSGVYRGLYRSVKERKKTLRKVWRGGEKRKMTTHTGN